jgi:hypothetical protein
LPGAIDVRPPTLVMPLIVVHLAHFVCMSP